MSPDIEWHFVDQAEPETIVKTTRRQPPRGRMIAVLLVILVGIGIGLAYRAIPEPAPHPTSTPLPPTATPRAIPVKLYETIDREAQALADGDLDSYRALQVQPKQLGANPSALSLCIRCDDAMSAWGRPSDTGPLYTIADFELRTPTKAWADVRQYRYGHWFRQTRFYQFNTDTAQWLRSEPDLSFWKGPEERLDAPHFHAIYALADRDLARSIVQSPEDAYPQLCRDLGCVEAAASLSYTLKLDDTSADGLMLTPDARELILPSPRLEGVFEDAPLASGYWLWGVVIAMTQRVYYGAATEWNGDSPGHIVFTAIINWALQQREDKPNALPAIAYFKTHPLAPLDNLWGKGYILDQTQENTIPRPDAAIVYPEAGLVIHFVVQAYGAQSIPQLLKTLGTAESFADVIENGLGVPFTEFDQKW